MITAELRRGIEQVDALRAEWERLFDSGPHQPSLSYEWTRAILRNHLARSSDWFVVVLKRSAEVVGIVPMMYMRERLLGVISAVTLQPVQQLYATHGSLLLDSTDVALLRAWLSALRSAPAQWDLLRVSRVLENEPLVGSVLSGALRNDARARVRLEQPSFHLALPNTYDEYLTARSGKFRNYLKRALKRLNQSGLVTFTRLCDAARFAGEFEDLLQIERGSWKHAHGTAISAIAHQTGFYEDLSRDALARGRLHLTFLRIDGRPVAYNLGVLSGGCYYYLKTSYLEGLRSLGVATVGRAKLIEALIADGIRTVDFPAEPYEWELQWTTDLRWHRSLLLFNRTLRGVALWLAISLRALGRRGESQRRVVFHDPRANRAAVSRGGT